LTIALGPFLELETLGICEPEKTIYYDFSKSVTFNNGRYQVSLPWREQHKSLPENYQLSLHRLRGLFKRLRQVPDVLQKYDDTIQEQIQMGILEDKNLEMGDTIPRLLIPPIPILPIPILPHAVSILNWFFATPIRYLAHVMIFWST